MRRSVKASPSSLKNLLTPRTATPGSTRPSSCPTKWTPLFRLRESVTVEGMGIPLAGLAPQGVPAPCCVLKDNGNVHTLTAILDFDRMVDGKPTLRTIPRLMNEHGVSSAKTRCVSPWRPLLRSHRPFWKLSRCGRNGTAGRVPLKRPSIRWGFYFSEPYDPRKIPVVFTHGLMSGPATFANLTNRLSGGSRHPGKLPVLVLRLSVRPGLDHSGQQAEGPEELMQEYNPRGDSREMNNIVMVGTPWAASSPASTTPPGPGR